MYLEELTGSITLENLEVECKARLDRNNPLGDCMASQSQPLMINACGEKTEKPSCQVFISLRNNFWITVRLRPVDHARYILDLISG